MSAENIKDRHRYTLKMGEEICMRLAEGESLRTICLDPAMPNRGTVMRWAISPDPKIAEKHKDFRVAYTLARQMQAHNYVDDIIDISDDSRNDYIERCNANGDCEQVVNTEAIQRTRLRVDSRKWIASKIVHSIYGDKLSTETKHTGVVQLTDMSSEELDRKIRQLESTREQGLSD